MNINQMEQIVRGDMPYKSGFMFNNGARFIDNNHFMMAIYDIERVPYIVFNELGTRYTTKNQYFIREKTIGDLNMALVGKDTMAYSRFEMKSKKYNEMLARQGLLERT